MASRDLKAADPKIVGIFQVVKAVFEKTFTEYELRPTCTYRSPEEQLVEYKAKRSSIDGTVNRGKHNLTPSWAIDIGIFRKSDGAYLEDLVAKGQFSKPLRDSLFWNIGLLAQKNGARWGGDWRDEGIPYKRNPIDPYHIELRGDV